MDPWIAHQPAVFLLTFSAYALLHAVRKTLSYVKGDLIMEWTPASPCHGPDPVQSEPQPSPACPSQLPWPRTRPSLFQSQADAEDFLGLLDAVFMFVYSAAMYFSGMMADRVNVRIMMCAGMFLAALSNFLFGPVLEWSGERKQPAYVVLMAFNGVFNSMLWPCGLSCMCNWFGRRNRGLILGIWASSPAIGSILGALISAAVVGYGYEYVFMTTSSALFATGVVVFFGLVTSPHELQLPTPEDGENYYLTTHERLVEEDGEPDDEPCIQDTILTSEAQEHKYLKTNISPVDGYGSTGTSKHAESVLEETRKGSYCDIDAATDKRLTDAVKAPDRVRKASGELEVPHETNHDSDLSNNGFHNTPADVEKQNIVGDREKDDTRDNGNTNIKPRPKAISFFRALLLPGVIPYTLAFTGLKTVNYVFFNWLPLYLTTTYGWPQSLADQLSLWFDVGALVSATAAGALGDRFQKRALIMSPLLALAIPTLYAYGALGSSDAGRNLALNSAMLVALGAFIGGMCNIIAAAISADVARRDAIRGDVEALSTVSGIIEGTGTLGAALGQMAVPRLHGAYGWMSVYYCMMVAVFVAALMILPITVAEVKDVIRNRRERRD